MMVASRTQLAGGGFRLWPGRRCAPALALTIIAAWAWPVAAQPTTQPAPNTRPASRPADDFSDLWREDESAGDTALLTLNVPTVVGATRRAKAINSLPYAVSVITSEDIRLSGARSVPDALRLAPGMDVAELSYGNAAVSPRGLHGFSSRHALVLVDGRQIFDGAFGSAIWGSWPFQLEDIERIEVIRGPGGVTWGANAVNGVINIVTKDPARQKGFTLTGGGGSRGVQKEHVGYGLEVGKLRLRVSGEYEGTDGFSKGGVFPHGLMDDYQAGRFGLHAIYDLNANDTFTLSAGHALMADGFAPSTMVGLDRPRDTGSQGSFILGRWNHRISEDNRVEVTGYVNDFEAALGVPSFNYRYQQYALQANQSFKPTENHTLTYGFDSRFDWLDGTLAEPRLMECDQLFTGTLGVFLEDEWRLAPRWTLNIGGRVDYEFYGGFQPSARASLAYDLTPESMAYVAVSRAFQMPPATLRFLDVPAASGLMVIRGDRDLRPMQLIAYEAGYRAKFFDKLSTDVNVFCHTYSDHTGITSGLGPPGLIAAEYHNAADATTYGLEWEGDWAVNDRLTLLGNYTFELMDWLGPRPFSETDQISMPKHKFMIGARYSPIDRLSLSSHLYYVDPVKTPHEWNPFAMRTVPSYFRLDLRAEYEIWKDRGTISVGVRNLLDDDHPEGTTHFLNNAEVPRMIYAEFRMSLK
jgi:iron complex outermembrane recepter protein